ncbi:MAG: hypothetical protein NPIRA02_25010 [Nitrospirales bacterium]|nr:MAG: hypothetical protein NPIRA02_25010 [Nitrospirales bacterium]
MGVTSRARVIEFPMNHSKELFIFAEAARHVSEIDEWLSQEPHELFSIARQWFTTFRQCGEDVDEIVHDGCPTACINGAAFGYVNVFTAHVNVGFFTGAFLPDPHKLLEGTGKRMRHVKIRPGIVLEAHALHELIEQAYVDVKGRAQQ